MHRCFVCNTIVGFTIARTGQYLNTAIVMKKVTYNETYSGPSAIWIKVSNTRNHSFQSKISTALTIMEINQKDKLRVHNLAKAPN